MYFKKNILSLRKNMNEIDTSIIFTSIYLLKHFGIEIKKVPRLIVLGEQNQGKSSVIESLIRSRVLPKSEGLCTRKPINITLINSEEYKFYLEDKEYDEKTISNEISKLNMNPMVKEINCTILSPNVYNCSIVDTVGLIEISEQDPNLDPVKIKESVMKYLKDENNIFVLVCSAAQDLANSRMLSLIKNSGRAKDTLGILTKMDLTENQSMFLINETLSGRLFPLGYGWIATKLRSDRDINNGVTIEDSLLDEEQYFKRRGFVNKCGIPEVRKVVSQIQFDKIKNNIPKIIEEIDDRFASMKGSQEYLKKISEEPESDLAAKITAVIEKMVPSSQDRVEFDINLHKKFREFLLQHSKRVYDYTKIEDFKKEISKEISKELVDDNIYNYNVKNFTNAIEIAEKNELDEIFEKGMVSQSNIEAEKFETAYQNECKLMTFAASFKFDVNNDGKNDWKRQSKKYITSLLNEDFLQNNFYKITETMLIEYINRGVDDDLSKRFTENMIKEIGNKAFQDKIKYSIGVIAEIEQIAHVKNYEIIKQIIKLTKCDHFNFALISYFWRLLSSQFKERMNIKLYSDIWSLAYLGTTLDRISHGCYRIVSLNLVSKMVQSLLIKVIELNRETSIKESEIIAEKMNLLVQARSTFEKFLPYC